MQYFISFIEGIFTFISPCLLPMLPIYITYFTAGTIAEKKNTALKNAIGFVLGFTVLFVAMGAFAASIGALLKQHTVIVNLITGAIVVLFGLNFLGILKIPMLKGASYDNVNTKKMNFWQSMLFGIIFSIGWTPCVGAFLGSALMLASHEGSVIKGVFMLLCYCAGLGIPFIISAVLLEKLKSTFDFIKKHYKIINILCGSLLCIMGVLMMTGLMGKFLTMLSF